MVNAFDLGSKDCGFKSCRPDNAESHNGSVGACKALGKGSIPFSALNKGQVAERLIAVVLKTVILRYRGFESHPARSFLSSIGRAIVL